MVTRSGVQGDVYGKKYSYICRANGLQGTGNGQSCRELFVIMTF